MGPTGSSSSGSDQYSSSKLSGQSHSKPADRFQTEWEQCLETIEKFEDRLDGLRRYGFSLVTGLLSADAVIWHVTGTAISTPVTLGAILSTGLLIVALWILDRDYRLYQRAVSERARTIEGILGYGLQRAVEYTYRNQKMWRYIQSLYWVFALAAAFIGIVVFVGESLWPLWITDPVALLLGLSYIWLVERRMWFFAYGSHMNAKRMQTSIGREITGEHAILIGYEMRFNKRSASNPNVGFANIAPQPEEEVHGVLYKIHESDLWKLDGVEVYPFHYGREEVDVKRDSGKMVDAQVYVGNPRRLDRKDTLKPTEKYLKLILEAEPKINAQDVNSWKSYKQNLELKAKGQLKSDDSL